MLCKTELPLVKYALGISKYFLSHSAVYITMQVFISRNVMLYLLDDLRELQE